MSQGGVFNLVVRDERFDKFFVASDYLRRRLDDVRKQRAAAKEPNVQPTFLDIERSHVLYVHGLYRPYVAVASEYVRVKASGDARATLGAGGGVCEFTLPTYGHFTSDMALHVRFRPVGSASAAAPSAETPYFRYCAFPGARLFRSVALKSAGTLIDDYGPDEAMAYGKFFVDASHRAGWERCMGQQVDNKATYFANGFSGTLAYSDGPQTPRLLQPAFDVFAPVQFWFCRDADTALLNDLIPNTQRTLTVTLAPLEDILEALLPVPDTPGHFERVALPFARLAIDIDLYVNNLFVNPEVHDVFASRIGFSLIRVHRRQLNQLQGPADRFLLDQIKYPVEFLTLGVRARSLAADFDRWWLMGAPVPRTEANALVVPAFIWNAGLAIFQLVVREATEVGSLDPLVDALGVTAHGVEIFPQVPAAFHGAYMPTRYAAGCGSCVFSPADAAALLVNFCLYPGRYTPSGYYNLSAGREMYVSLQLKEAYTNIAPGFAEMPIMASCLNFVLRRGDAVVLRFSL